MEWDIYEAPEEGNTMCLDPKCGAIPSYFLPGGGSWPKYDKENLFGNAHCPECGHGKFIDEKLIIHPIAIIALRRISAKRPA
jgi:hypothetical protein